MFLIQQTLNEKGVIACIAGIVVNWLTCNLSVVLTSTNET